ncbi:putative Surp module [Monocercomonoides exilis]|uniref:putative Surp module n=1 Tax=Monocercomonoides exilis TaxID=2049356 RepID=UPI003559AEA7|nr:putative Surp module [Monocercomonoides exilis]|eukprot:MONOS_6602.1-p1 / transcript=MONOS_6602.1 / gene=MONOS_6602 / organism=Monocercomonoides_exilis_PA203 / gene_product=unspecified product / transcript_product=unspecified product / location=Mono_scaffold00211:6535-8363(-) / protein_length=554 / sequence_SO=supercontig / SO=protein_coding / is_pseudo=false
MKETTELAAQQRVMLQEKEAQDAELKREKEELEKLLEDKDTTVPERGECGAEAPDFGFSRSECGEGAMLLQLNYIVELLRKRESLKVEKFISSVASHARVASVKLDRKMEEQENREEENKTEEVEGANMKTNDQNISGDEMEAEAINPQQQSSSTNLASSLLNPLSTVNLATTSSSSTLSSSLSSSSLSSSSSSSSCFEESSSCAASVSSDNLSKSATGSSETEQSSSSSVLTSEPDSVNTFSFAIGWFSLLCSCGRISETEAVLRERDVRQLFGELGQPDYVAVNQKKRYAFVAFFTTEEAVCAKLTVKAALKEMKEIKGYKENEKEEIGEGEEKEKVIEKGKQEIEKQCCMHIGYAKKTIPLYHHSNNSARKKKKMNKVKNEEKDEKEDNHNHTMKEGIFSLNQNKNAIFPTAPLENVDLEHVIEKMAMYVVVKGKGFETKMREEKKQFPLFSFLREGGEGNEYYKWRVFCALNGISEEESGKRVIRYAQGKRWDVPECFLGARHPIISKIVRPDEEEEKCADGKEEAEKGIRTQNDGDCNRKQSEWMKKSN